MTMVASVTRLVATVAVVGACLSVGQDWVVGATWAAAEVPDTRGAAGEMQATVVRVVDGDTDTLQMPGRRRLTVRLASIDAPEQGRDGLPAQPHAGQARSALERLVQGKDVTVRCYEYDHHGRAICDLKLDAGETVNRWLVREGHAWVNREKRGRFVRDPRLYELEAAARRERRGIWADDAPKAPWQWRYDCWHERRCN